ncbi:hypothetical protein [Kribbella sp. NPDC004536]|uniref:hypothetical protein n=1 Tax=Kribbella sp. NPDC004536 TaxID=3364106 RepID=UPI00368766E9
MDGQQAEGVSGAGGGPSAAELAKLREFLGDHTAADSPGSYKGTGEAPNNVRSLVARRQRPANEVD